MLQTPEGDYCILQTPVTNGLHSVTHPSPDASFLVLVYGYVHAYGYALAYGYVAGYNIDPAETVESIYSTMSTGALRYNRRNRNNNHTTIPQNHNFEKIKGSQLGEF